MKKVLVVDDSPDIAESTAMFLKSLGYETLVAYNGQEAVNAATCEKPDVVLLDLHMPVLDGFDAARAIRDAFPDPPPVLVALSAVAHLSTDIRLNVCGFDHRMTKPADIEKLVQIIEGTR